jgi:hypothetical protein
VRHVAGDELDAGVHQAGDEMHIARQPIELRDDKLRPLLFAGCERSGELRTVVVLAALDLDELGFERPRGLPGYRAGRFHCGPHELSKRRQRRVGVVHQRGAGLRSRFDGRIALPPLVEGAASEVPLDVRAVLARGRPRQRPPCAPTPPGLSRANRTNLPEAQAKGVAVNRKTADAFAANVLPVVRQIQAAGATTFRAIAAALNDRGVRTARGGAWHDSTVRNLLARAG